MCNCTKDNGKMNLTQADLMKYGIAAGVLFAAYKFGPAVVKGGAIAVAAVAVAKNVPYLNQVV
jgi:hypothetical protein